MKRLALFILLAAGIAQAQRIPQINLYNANPTGAACTTANTLLQSSTTGGIYSCTGGVYVSTGSGGGGGTPGGATNTVQVNSGGAFGGATPIGLDVNTATPYIFPTGAAPTTNGVRFTTDSIGAGVGVYRQELQYFNEVLTDLGLSAATGPNNRQSGSSAGDLAYLYPYRTVPKETGNPVEVMEFGTNDADNATAQSNHNSFSQSQMGLLTWASLVPSERVFNSPQTFATTLFTFSTSTVSPYSQNFVTETISAGTIPSYVAPGYNYTQSGATSAQLTALNGTTLPLYALASNNTTTANPTQFVFPITSLPTFVTDSLTSVSAPVNGIQTFTGTITGGGSNAKAGFTFVTTGFSNSTNNVSCVAIATTATTYTCTNPTGVVETASATATEMTVADTVTLTPANWTYTGTWTTDTTTLLLGVSFQTTTQNGATATLSNYNVGPSGVVGIHYPGYFGGTGTETLSVDGTPCSDFITSSTSLLNNNGANPLSNFGSAGTPMMAAICTGITPGSHGITITNTNGAITGFNDVFSPQGKIQHSTNGTYVVMAGAPYQSGLANETNMGIYNGWSMANVAQLSAWGFPIYPADLRKHMNSTSDFTAAGGCASYLPPKHPGCGGMRHDADAILEAMGNPQIAYGAQWTNTTIATANSNTKIINAPGSYYVSGGNILLGNAKNAAGPIMIFNSSTTPTVVTATGNSIGNISLNANCGGTWFTAGSGQWFLAGMTCPRSNWVNLPLDRWTGTGTIPVLCTDAHSEFSGSATVTISLPTNCSEGTTQSLKNLTASSMNITGQLYGDAPATLAAGASIILTAVQWGGAGGWECISCASSGGPGTVTSFTSPSASWPTWLVPTVTNSTTTPSLAVAASVIPVAAGGTGLATQTANAIYKGNGTSAESASGLTDNGTTFAYAGGGAYNLLQITSQVFSVLPTCVSGLNGAHAPVTDSTTTSAGATITGGGSGNVEAYCNGTNWLVGSGGGASGGGVNAGTINQFGYYAAAGSTISGLSLTGYVKGNGASLPTASAGVPTTDLSGTLAAAQEPAFTGDVTKTAGSLATSITTLNSGALAVSSIAATGTPLWLQYLGDGSDGANTTASGNLSGEKYYTNFTVPFGNTVTVNNQYGLVIHATGTCTVAGIINARGVDLSSFAGVGGGAGGGSGGGAAAGTSGTATFLSASISGTTASANVGSAGAITGGNGGGGGTAQLQYQRSIFNSGLGLDGALLSGGSGKAGGSAGGALGAGGGGVVLICNAVTGTDGTHTGTIDVSGGFGTPAAANSTGSGSGGGGGVIILSSHAAIATPPNLSVAGGPGGLNGSVGTPEALATGGTCTTPPTASLGVTAGALSGVCTVQAAGAGCGTGTGVTFNVVGGGGTLGTGTVNPTWSSGTLASCTTTAGTSSGYTAATFTTAGAGGNGAVGWTRTITW